MPHLTSLEDLSGDELADLLRAAEAFKKAPPGQLLDGRLVVSAFYEPSTRTRLSFEAAALRLGAKTLGFADQASTSAAKGESLEDSIRVLGGYGDAIVLRHPDTGAAKRAAEVSGVPILNAGDGRGEHPTQALLDVMTMTESLGTLEGKHVVLVGDLANGRTAHSLAPLLATLGAQVSQAPAAGLAMEGVPTMGLEEAARGADVLYMTRIQRERMAADADPLTLDPSWLGSKGPLIMHPLPRLAEIPRSIDTLPTAKYFEQAQNGVPTRMAVLAWALGELP